jgi:hypothetical protein
MPGNPTFLGSRYHSLPYPLPTLIPLLSLARGFMNQFSVTFDIILSLCCQGQSPTPNPSGRP